MSSALVQVTAPGLPRWPRLMLDARNKRAVVSARLTTWRSYKLAIRTSKCVRLLVNVVFACWVWSRFPFDGDVIARVGITVVALALFAAFTRPIINDALRPFLARQVFAFRTTAWFTPDAIAFRSRLYTNGVILWRSWKGRPVQGRFDLDHDPEARCQHSALDQGSLQERMYVDMARILRLIVSTVDPHRVLKPSDQPSFSRSIPIVEIDQRDASKFTVVLAAAASLTMVGNDRQALARDRGVDIDAS